MNKYIRCLPIKQKIIAISMVTSIIVVFVAAVVFFVTQYRINQNSLVNSTATLARIVGVNAQAAIMFHDNRAGKEILSALAEKPQVISAEILNLDGSQFASYSSNEPEHIALSSTIDKNEEAEWKESKKIATHRYLFFASYLDLDQKITVEGKVIGYIDIQIDLSQMHDTIKWQAIITILVMFFVSLLGFILISWLQTFISTPIKELNSTIKAISRRQGYTLRATKYSEDELGTLTEAFNLMLGKIVERDIKLEHTLEELKEANEKAEQASLAKSNFLASMSHEIRTPMNGVLGMVNLMMQTRLDKNQRHYAKTIQNSGKTLLTIINDVLDFSKIEANKLSLEAVPFNLPDVIEELGRLFAERLRSTGINMVTSMSVDFPTAVIGDSSRLNQVLYNLLGNAIKFTTRGQIIVTCRSEGIEDNKNLLYFEVKDNGVGISDEKQKHLFEAFYQAHNDEEWTESGTGLGLAIAKNLCEAMDGSIGVNSKLGLGSTFWFTVKLGVCDESELNSRYLISDTEKPEKVNFKANVLLAEDNLVNQDVARGSLEFFGCTVTIANNGQEALNLFAEKLYDLILMDFSMPIMDGKLATKNIRNQEKQLELTRTPIVALTAHAVPGIEQQCIEAEMDDYLSKPFSLPQLFQVLERWLPPASYVNPDEQKNLTIVNRSGVDEVEEKSSTSIAHAQEELVSLEIFEQVRSLQQSGAPSLVNRMIQHYQEEFPVLLDRLENALMEGDAEKLWKTAHSLKSSSAGIGANSLARIFAEIEYKGQDNQISGINLGLIKSIYPKVISALCEIKDVE